MSNIQLIQGDCLEKLKELDDNSVDSIVTDPPYGLSFMGKKWDYDVPTTELWEEALRVLKPGGHLLAFFGTRTYHRGVVRIEDAGFEIRDQIMWVYGSGFPKSHNIGKAVDKLQGNERVETGEESLRHGGGEKSDKIRQLNPDWKRTKITKGNSPYEGWGTALKPAVEPIVVARKPLSEKSVAQNVLKWGTGGINIDGCRVGNETITQQQNSGGRKFARKYDGSGENLPVDGITTFTQGRFPANLIHDGSDEVVGLFPETKSGNLNSGHKQGAGMFGKIGGEKIIGNYGGDSGSAARFFYCAKASKSERNAGLEGFEERMGTQRMNASLERHEVGREPTPRAEQSKNKNFHPTVKPIKLMQYLCRLVTPKGGTVLDPFMGSGSTGIASKKEGFDFIGIEREAEYIKIAEARIDKSL